MVLPLHPLGQAPVTLGGTRPLTLTPLPDGARFSLRLDPRALAAAAACLGQPLPNRIGETTRAGDTLCLQLGPDEWFIIAPEIQGPLIAARFAALAEHEPHSLVDVSHREVGILLEGRDATLALQSAIAFDIAAMPVGSGCRTVFDKAQILLLRESDERYRIEVWHSSAMHVWTFLKAVAQELVLENAI